MYTFAGMMSEGGPFAKVAVLFGLCSVALAFAQLFVLRRVNLVPAIVGTIAVTFFAGLLGQTTGLIQAFDSLGGASPEERSVLLSKGQAVSMYPMALALSLCFISALVGTVAATLRANLKPLADKAPHAE